MRVKNAVVTGANGFIGSAVCQELLKNNISVIAIVRDKTCMMQMKHNNMDVIEADPCEYKNLSNKLPKDVDVFYHVEWDGAYGPIL